MKVTLIEYTGSGHPDPADYAAGLLIFAKNTRLTMSPGALQEALEMHPVQKRKQLEYIAQTIPSSWEFVDYTFLIEDVTRAFTHQFVRSRQFSFAQQTMRMLNMGDAEGWDYLTGPTIKGYTAKENIYHEALGIVKDAYNELINMGASIEDARGVLPTNILTNIVGKCNMRTFVELVRKRSSSRVQGEYRDVLFQMQEQVRAVHPWIELFIERNFDVAANDLDAEIQTMEDKTKANRMVKLLDQLRTQS